MLDFGKRTRSGNNGGDSDDLFASDSSFGAAEVEKSGEAAVAASEEKGDAVEKNDLPVSSSMKKKRRRIADAESGKLESVRLLEEARCRMGLSAADVEEITKIRSVYINALERGNFDELPQPVYILAYIRRLCELYGMSAEEQKQVVEPWCEISFESPDNYSTTVYSDESGDNRKVIRKLEAVIFSVVALAVVALAVFGIILLVSFVRGNSGNDDVAFDEAGIVNLQTARDLKVVEPMPQLRR
ncbi:MAG: helix-turn-helix domain-containing protein [Lentisphaerae bacterium]|nr:helix-turn-helix domain-containing protein [Lentisphaerota bacterium]